MKGIQKSILCGVLFTSLILFYSVEANNDYGNEEDSFLFLFTRQLTTRSTPKLSDIDAVDIIGIIFLCFGLALASAGGIGGGVIIVPVLVLIIGFDLKFATPISNLIILGGAIANAIFNMQKRHPLVDRPLIDVDISLAMIPPVIGGTVIGAVLAKLLPNYLTSILLAILLFISGSRSVQKGLRLHKKEVNQREKTQQELESLEQANKESDQELPQDFSNLQSPNQPPNVKDEKSDAQLSLINFTPENKRAVLQGIQESERHFSWWKHSVIMVCFLGILAASIGGAHVACGSVTYWFLLFGEIPWVVLFSVLSGIYLNRFYKLKVEVDYPFVEGDVKWNAKSVIWFPLLCSFAGIVAGLLGVGGGIIMGPIMIELHVIPQVASATSAWMIFYSSAAAVAKFALFNMINWEWALTLAALSFVVTLISQKFILGYVRKTGRESIIVFCIAFTILVGACLMTYQSIRSTIRDASKPFAAHICT